VVDLVQLPRDVYVGGNVVIYVVEVPLALQVSHLLHGARSQVVHTNYAVPFREQSLAGVTADEAPPLTSARLLLATPEAPVAYPGSPDLPRVEGIAAVHEHLGLLHEGCGLREVQGLYLLPLCDAYRGVRPS
jgi:hypothetical protein